MTDVKKYKRIGWIVETRRTKDSRWFTAPWSYSGYYRDSSMQLYSEGTNCDYKRDRKHGLARTVPVYVEVLDES